jgi:hypothetical protein
MSVWGFRCGAEKASTIRLAIVVAARCTLRFSRRCDLTARLPPASELKG